MLFTGIRYSISSTLPTQRQNELSKILDANGASIVEFPDATHVVSNTLQFEGRDLLSEDAHIVTDEWVDRCIVQGKLQETKYYSADPIMIFSGVVACVADLEPCDTEVIAAGINALGGLFREGYTRDCTHVLAARPDSDKYLTAMHYASATRVKVVLPHWFDDCFKLLTRLSEEPYLWPDPPLLRTNYALSKARLAPSTKVLVKAAVFEEEPAEKIAALGRSKSNNIWRGRRILLSSSLNLTNGRREAVEACVKRSGGVIVQLSGDEVADVDSADVYVTLHRFGSAFVKAIRSSKTVGTLSWLFNIHEIGIVTSPLDQLLHFPSPRAPLPGFENHKITATNYEGNARRYLKKLIELMGGSFTPQMTAQNTVVIAAYIKGEKSTKAREWNIPVVNHTWLEDCFASWTLVTPAQEKYVSFPPGVNFGDLVCRRTVSPLTDDELVGIERASLEAESAEKEKADVGQAKVERIVETGLPSNSGQYARAWNTLKSTPTRPADMKAGRSAGDSPLKLAGASLNAQRISQREGAKEEEEEEVSQPPRARGRVLKRRRESDDESALDTAPRRGRGQVSPTNRATRSRARSDIDSDNEEEHTPWRADTSVRKTSSTRKSSYKGIHESALKAINDAEFSSDGGFSPIKASKKLPVQQSTKVKPRLRTSRHEEEEEEEEEDVVPRNAKRAQRSASGHSKSFVKGEDPKTPLRKQPSLKGPTPGKVVFVEIPSPQKSSSQLSQTHSVTAALADVASDHVSPKHKHTAARSQKHDQENESPLSSSRSPQESPSRPNRFSNDAVLRSSQPTPIMLPANIQRTPSRRQAASKASAKLHENALDIIKFEKEKRSGRFRGAWEDGSEKTKVKSGPEQRRSSAVRPPESDAEEKDVKGKKKRKSDDVDKAAETGKKSKKPRVSNPVSEEEDDDEAEASEKEPEEGTIDASDIRLMTTQVVLSDQILKGLRQLGVKMASKPTECNLLLANNIGRTEKFLCAIATAHSIVTEAWAADSVKAKRILPPDNYFLKDPDGEKKHKFKLFESLRRAQSSEKKLLEGHTFYLTKSLHRSEKLATYRNIIQSAGGKVILHNPTVRILTGHPDRHVLTVEADSSITNSLKDEGFRIYIPEFILVGILTQRMDWETTPHRLDRN